MSSRADVARIAGVSARTVSNVVNGFEHVAPATRARVEEAIKRLEYVPNEFARSLRRGRSGLLGLMLPELDTPYFAELTRAFVEDGADRGFTVVIDQTDGDPERELAFLARSGRGSLFDGLIVSPLSSSSDRIRATVAGSPVVFLGEDSYPGFDKVMIDNRLAAREAVDHLIDSGRRRIAIIGAEAQRHGSSALRLSGALEALRDRGLSEDIRRIRYVKSFSRAEGARAATELLYERVDFDAVFSFSDPLALGALYVFLRAGVEVPSDVALVGFDDVQDGQFATPSLTTIAPDKRWIASRSLDRLVGRIDGEDFDPITQIAPHRLIVRESSGD